MWRFLQGGVKPPAKKKYGQRNKVVSYDSSSNEEEDQSEEHTDGDVTEDESDISDSDF